ncbi:hypothetical protein TWF192_010074 [Orbilia oligospora]|uniref:CHAT domain-containing protein n=1 Tax=Orbilia oligospora TaxID=2813651 RepID=A0A6G1M0R8_ORBOL|nr:hypothetical protein TWF191_000083 [Orbilia oligospora]KAF3239379.1 hypothetical protein TWF192_010074 [Orbilia oligospora]
MNKAYQIAASAAKKPTTSKAIEDGRLNDGKQSLRQNLRIRELEHGLERKKSGLQATKLECELAEAQATLRMKKLEHELEVLKGMNLLPAHLSLHQSGEGVAELVHSKDPTQLTAGKSQDHFSDQAESSSNLELGHKGSSILPGHKTGCSSHKIPDTDTNRCSPALSIVTHKVAYANETNARSGLKVPDLTMKYYRELDLPEDGIESSFLDMPLDQLYEIASGLQSNTEAAIDIQETRLLSKAITATEKVVANTNVNDLNYVAYLKNLITLLVKKYECSYSITDLDQSILRGEEILTLHHCDWDSQIDDLIRLKKVKCLYIEPDSTLELEEMMFNYDVVAATCLEAASTSAFDIPSRHHKKFEKTGDINHLEKAIQACKENIAATWYPQDKSRALGNLSLYLFDKFNRTGNLHEIHRVIKTGEEALKVSEMGSREHPERALFLTNFSNFLIARYNRTGDLEDLQKSIKLGQEALGMCQENITYHKAGLSLGALASFLLQRFCRTDDLDDLDQAIEAGEEASTVRLLDGLDVTIMLTNLAASYQLRYEKTGNNKDLQMAVERGEGALAAMPTDKPQRTALLSSIEAGEKAVAGTHHNDREMGTGLINLAESFRTKFDYTGAPADFEKAVSPFQEAARISHAAPKNRIFSARSVALMLATENRWVEGSNMAALAVELLPLMAPRQLAQRDQRYILGEFAGLAPIAASLIIIAGKDGYASRAVQLLELGRGVITGLRFGTRSDLTMLRLRHPEVAQRVVEEIRRLPEFKNFLRPPQAGELVAAASGGPIIFINVSMFRCDALLVQSRGIRSLALPDLREKDIKSNVEFINSVRSGSVPASSKSAIDRIFHILEWLWDATVSLILNELGFSGPPLGDDWPRVWWVPTGQLTSLPLHAAGYHRRQSTDTTLDRVISSYSPSIKALMYCRSNSRIAPKFSSDEALLVCMNRTPGYSDLEYTTEEVDALEGLLSNQIQTVKLERPTKREVLEHLSKCTIYHFAGHGKSDPLDPSKSALLVSDWEENSLTVEQLIGLDFRKTSRPPWLAYLSACSTSDSNIKKLHGESINLATACQLAGFQHVVGTLWEVSDRESVNVAKDFYHTIDVGGVVDDWKVSLGVHKATRRLRGATMEKMKLKSLGSPESEGVASGGGKGARSERRVRPLGYEENPKEEWRNPLVWAAPSKCFFKL